MPYDKRELRDVYIRKAKVILEAGDWSGALRQLKHADSIQVMLDDEICPVLRGNRTSVAAERQPAKAAAKDWLRET